MTKSWHCRVVQITLSQYELSQCQICKLDDNETLEQAAIREAREELGVTVLVYGFLSTPFDAGNFRFFVFEVDSSKGITTAFVPGKTHKRRTLEACMCRRTCDFIRFYHLEWLLANMDDVLLSNQQILTTLQCIQILFQPQKYLFPLVAPFSVKLFVYL